MKRFFVFVLVLVLFPLSSLAADRALWAYQGNVAYFEQNGKIGLINKTNIPLIAPTLDEVQPFYDKVANVREGTLWGLISQTGRWLRQPFSITEISFENDGEYARYSPEEHCYGFVNRKGETVLEPQKYQDAGFLSEGVFAAHNGTGYGYVGLDGQPTIDFQFDGALAFTEGLAAVQKDGKWGYINHQGDTVIPFQYEEAGIFVNGMAAVLPEAGAATVYIDPTGDVCLTGGWDKAYDFTKDKLARVCVSGKYGFINQKGKLVVAARYGGAQDFSEGYASVMVGESDWRFIDTKGKIVTKSYAKAGSYRCETVYVQTQEEDGGTFGYLNRTKKWICKELEGAK